MRKINTHSVLIRGILFVIFLCLGRMAYGQLQNIPLGNTVMPNLSVAGFHQEFNTYIWNYQLNTTKKIGKKTQFSLQENFRSSMLRLSNNEDRWKDDQNLKVIFNYQILPTFIIESGLASISFVDKQSGFNNDIQTHVGQVGIKMFPLPNVSVLANVGPKWDYRLEQKDVGTTVDASVAANDVDLGGYNNNLYVTIDQDRFSERQNRDFNFQHLISKEFVPGTSDSIRIFDTYQRRDNYTSQTGDIESIRESVRGLNNLLSYKVSDVVRLRARSTFQFKNVELQSVSTNEERLRKRNDQYISNSLSMQLEKKKMTGGLHLTYWSQIQSYDIETDKSNTPFSKRTAFVTPDNESNRLLLTSDFGLKLGRADSVYTYFSVSRFQYDTPDTNNFDDRDELRLNSRFVGIHRFSPFLKLELNASVNLYHLVYIFGERSADNNWNRIFSLNPRLEFTPNKNFRLKQSFEVLANYVDYDFEDQSVLTKSFVFRKFAVEDSVLWRVSLKSMISVGYRLELEENGQLSWDDWTERVLITRRSQWFRVLWNYSILQKFTLAPGFSVYSRNEWRHNNDQFGVEVIEKADNYSSYGPIFRLYYLPSQKLQLTINANRQAVHAPGQKKYYLNNIDIRLNWYF